MKPDGTETCSALRDLCGFFALFAFKRRLTAKVSKGGGAKVAEKFSTLDSHELCKLSDCGEFSKTLFAYSP